MRYAVLMFAALSFVGCSILEDDVARGYAQNYRFTTPVTFTTADIRVITQRKRPNSNDPIICTEPSPDVAKALSTAAQVSAQGGNAGTTGSFGAGGGSAEAALALAGRSTALLGLRDGLYRACEAYANGAIGADAYALVLSRYGQLMTTLFLGQDITGAAGTEAGASVQSPPVTVNLPATGSATAGSAQGTTTGGTAAPASQTSGTQVTSNAANSPAPVALTRMNEDYLNLDYSLGPIVIACINYADPTRVLPVQSEVQPRNWWLDTICPELAHVTAYSALAGAAAALVKGQILASPVDPAAGAVQSMQKQQPAKVAAPPRSTR